MSNSVILSNEIKKLVIEKTLKIDLGKWLVRLLLSLLVALNGFLFKRAGVFIDKVYDHEKRLTVTEVSFGFIKESLAEIKTEIIRKR